MTFMIPTFLDERIFVTPTCSLRFRRVRKADEGVYSCYKRDLRFPSQWQSHAFVSFRLKIEEPSMKFPVASEILLGLLILTTWACLLILLWLVLSIWSLEVNKTAIIQAGERKRRKEKLAAFLAESQANDSHSFSRHSRIHNPKYLLLINIR
ncbi:unnamed protein product [Mesocestoides corti]|uniref:Ig-like domain-containing protein n=1 Tax=Mesocestoides corti TaxID=53468 RepID=A0A0R3U2B0_MESCO|nr:unnamed protein product [Mesocestoides corti]